MGERQTIGDREQGSRGTGSRIVLIGLRAAGKSVVGRELARLLGTPFQDSDEWIEERSGRSPGDLLRELGEERFRRIERAALLSRIESFSGVLALGGGAPGDPLIRSALRGWRTVLLDAPDPVLLQRMERDATSRPPLTSFRPLEEIAELRRRRWASYLELDPFIVWSEEPPPQVAERIFSLLQEGARPST